MSAKSSRGNPDAWEDDWEKAADNLSGDEATPPPEKKVSSKVTKAQRRAQQAEFNRQLWAEADSPQTFHYLEARSDDVPFKQEFKPAVTLLSRKPQLAKRPSSSSAGADSAAAGLAHLGLSADAGDDSSDELDRPPEPTPEERHAMALKNREEKQRKYEEVRERLFGSPSGTTSGASSPRSGTPPNKSYEGRGKGKNRGGNHSREKRDSSTASSKSRQLYDPGYSPKPNPAFTSRNERQQSGERAGGDQSPRQPIRNPRGPDPSGRGGFRSGPRGAKAG